MADKSPKYIDIKPGGKTKPSDSSRPLVVTNRSVLGNDPMVNPDDGASEGKPAVPMARTAKTINPVSDDMPTSTSPIKVDVSSADDADAKPAAAEKITAEKPEDQENYIAALTAPETEAKPAETPEPVPETKQESEPGTTAEVEKPSEPAETAPEAEPEVAPKKEAPDPVPDSTDTEPSSPGIPPNRDSAAQSQADEAKAAAEAEAAAAREAQLENEIEIGKYFAPINAAHHKRMNMLAMVLALVAILLAVAVADAAIDAGLVSVSGVPHTNLLKDK